MKKPKITEGEWQISASGHPNFKYCIMDKHGGSICHISNWQGHTDNAKAISAVPQMVDALVDVNKFLKQPPWDVKYLIIRYAEVEKRIEQALIKAGAEL